MDQLTRGMIHPDSGLVYWGNNKGLNGWVSQERFDQERAWHRSAVQKYDLKNREAINIKSKQRYRKDILASRAKGRESSKRYYYRNRELEIYRSMTWAMQNPERNASNRMAYKPILNEKRRTNPKYIENRRHYINNRLKTDPRFKLTYAMRRRIRMAVKALGVYKTRSTRALVGCWAGELKTHIESLWKEGMTWENYGLKGWHIDHIIPLASADSVESLERLCHYTNLQPLWAQDNMLKSDKILNGTT